MFQSVIWEDVQVIDKWTNKKGTKCVKIGWLSKKHGAGEHVFFGDTLFDRVAEGDVVTVRGKVRGDFVDVDDVQGGSFGASGATDGAAGDPATSTRRRTRAAA